MFNVVQDEVKTLSELEVLLLLLLLEQPIREKKPIAAAASKEIFTFLTV